MLYSRRHPTCGYCGADLPAEVLFTVEEIAAIDAEQAELAARRAREKEKDEEYKKRQAAANAAWFPPPPF